MFRIPQTPTEWADRAMGVIVLILSLTVHEWAHAFSAKRLGDDTAEREGRLTLNPMVHIDPLGTVVMPLLGFFLGWARPVPFNPARFRRGISMAWGTMITKAAGPLSNLLLAILCAVGLGLLHLGGSRAQGADPMVELLGKGLLMNVGLAVFNMLPVHPLDGAGVLEPFIPRGLRGAWESYLQAGPILLMVVVVLGGAFLSGPISALTRALLGLTYRIAA